jgi:ELWxxDGT repeat protein
MALVGAPARGQTPERLTSVTALGIPREPSGSSLAPSPSGLVLFAVGDDRGVELWRSDLTAGGTGLVRDIQSGPGSSWPSHLTSTGTAWLFSADDGVHGRELWRSDGTASGTRLVKDVRPGAPSSSPGYCGSEGLATTTLGSAALLFADDGLHGTELWRTDGTEAGTFLLKDIRPGSAASQEWGRCWPEMVAVGSRMYFVANDGVHGAELWRTDGTGGGTRLLKDTRPGSADEDGPSSLTAVGGRLFFIADGQLWSSDGTAAGTVPVGRTVPWSEIVSFGGRAFFAADFWGDDELWVSDGTTAGTRIVSDLGSDSSVSGLVALPGTIVLFVNRRHTYTELWVSDGTSAGTRFVTALGGDGLHAPDELTPAGSTLYFSFGAEFPEDSEPWRTDGTAAGTRRVRDLRPGPEGSLSGCWDCAYPRMAPAGGGIVFFGDDGASGDALWKSDGTEAGTALLASWLAPSPMAVAGEGLFFVAAGGSSGFELWRTEARSGTEALVKDIRPGGAASAPSELTAVEDVLYFAADDGESGRELWRSDGTEAGTVRVRDIRPGTLPSNPGELTALGGLLLFSAEDAAGRELWRSDGTEAGTVRVLDIKPGPAGSSPDRLTVSGGLLYFVASSPDSPIAELWRTDGTASGTIPLTDLKSAYTTVSITELEDVGGALVFATAGSPEGLWRSDGTPAGTFLVKASLPPGPSQLTAVDGEAFFTAAPSPDSAGGGALALWASDGTAGGTRLVREIGGGGLSTSPQDLTALGGRLLFTADDGVHGREPWTSDGTASGTQLVADVRPGPEGSGPAEIVALWDASYMAADDGMLGRELWTSDGTAGGTGPLADIRPGPEGSGPARLTAEGGLLHFAADDGGGLQVWWLPATPGLAVHPVSVTEGDSGTVDAVFKVSLLTPNPDPVSVDFATVDGSATAGSDYEARSGSLAFAPGDREHEVVVRVTGDGLFERDETFQVELSNPRGAPITRASATGRIRDDDGALVRVTLPGGATGLNFTAILGNGTLAAVTGPQSGDVSFLSAPAAWSVEATTTGAGDWLRVTPGGGDGPATVRFEVADSGSFVAGTFRARARFGGAEILNEVVVDVTLTVSSAPSAAPFGFLDTPSNGATGVTGAVPVTGWALDDVEVTKVEVYRDLVAGETPTPGGSVYVGDGTFVSGARPDISRLFPDYPWSQRAGWGYMFLTNMLPGQGNGPFTLYAYAHDPEGHVTLLGSRAITCTNAAATRPFGTIDTPAQGHSVSGSAYNVFGWALTPQPGTIPTDGSTLQVYVDGVPLGHPTYDLYRSDIATLFPGYANSDGAVGLFVLDTTTLSNGIHTIAWAVTDDLGRSDGIGSRYFWVQN